MIAKYHVHWFFITASLIFILGCASADQSALTKQTAHKPRKYSPIKETTKPGFEFVTHKTATSSIQIPSDWTVKFADGVFVATGPKEKGESPPPCINVLTMNVPDGPLRNIMRTIEQDLASQIDDFSLTISQATAVESLNDAWMIIYDGSNNGAARKWIQMIGRNGTSGYVVTCHSSRDSFDDNVAIFTRAVESFRAINGIGVSRAPATSTSQP